LFQPSASRIFQSCHGNPLLMSTSTALLKHMCVS